MSLFEAPTGQEHPPLIAVVRETILASWPGTKIKVEHATKGSWTLYAGLALTRGLVIHVLETADSDPRAALVMVAPHTRLASVLTIASGLSFFLVGLAGMVYFFLVGGLSEKMAILAGLAVGAAIAGPLFGLAWLVDNVINPLGPRAVARFQEGLAARIDASFPPAA